jgi:hypothetical protein
MDVNLFFKKLQEETKMNEKAFKTMGITGAAGIAIGIVMIVVGVTTGVIAIVCGGRLLKNKEGLMF